MNDNQNFFVQDGRTTSRVLSQPGGQASLMFGGWSPEELKRMEEQRQQKDAVLPNESEPDVKQAAAAEENSSKDEELSSTKGESSVPKDGSNEEQKRRSVSSNAFASGANMNSGNVISERPTSRVLAPPGGHTSIRLG